MSTLTDDAGGTDSELHREWAADKDTSCIVEQRRTQNNCPDEPRHEVVDATRYLVRRADCEVPILYKVVVYLVLHRKIIS